MMFGDHGSERPRPSLTMEARRRARASLVDERNREAGTRRERGGTFRYVVELIGADTDSERAISWLIALMVAVLRSARHRIDRGSFGAAIHCLKPFWSAAPSIAVAPTRS